MLKVVFIRHFSTYGNQLKRYIGITDEELYEPAIPNLEQLSYPQVEEVFVSPLIRCRQTAAFIYPELVPTVCEDFKECNFGEFENKNYLEMSGNTKYQEWIDSGGTMAFPGGEEVTAFKSRCIREFQNVISYSLKKGCQAVALVVHGGTIMSILEHYADKRQDYYYWQVENGNGYIAEFEELDSIDRSSGCDGLNEQNDPDGHEDLDGQDDLNGRDDLKGLDALKGKDDLNRRDDLKGRDELKGLDALNELEDLDGQDALKGLDALNGIDVLNRGHDLDQIDGVKRTSGLCRINKQEEIDELNSLSRLKGINRVEGRLINICNIHS